MAKDFWDSFTRDKSGQSLMEIIVGLSIGAVLIGTASYGIAFMIRSTTTNQNLSTASQLTQGALNNLQSFSNSSWQNIYGLSKGSGNQYFLNASGTNYIAVQGQEGLIDNDVTNGLVSEWKLDETTGTIAHDSVGSNPGSASSIGWATSTCKLGDCVNASSTYQTITVNAPTFSNLHSNVTITNWVKINTAIPASSWPYSAGGNTHVSYGFRSASTGTKWRFEYGTDYPTCGGAAFSANGDDDLGLNTWHFLVMTYDGSVFNKYLDGVLIKQTSFTTGLCGITTFYIANQPASPGSFSVDDVRFYNRALSASEVKQLYNSQVFTRYFYVDNVCRMNDSSGSITSSASPCPGGTVDDPLTQKVTAITQWIFGVSADQVSLSRYVSRWGNFSIRQSDWSGGSGQNGVITSPNSLYSSSTNIAVTSTLGSFQILNLSQ